MVKKIKSSHLQIIIIGCQIVLWYLIFGIGITTNNTYRLTGGIYTELILILLQLFLCVYITLYTKKTNLNYYSKVYIIGFQVFNLVFSGLLTVFLLIGLLIGIFQETTYISPSGRHSITIEWSPISGSNTVYINKYLFAKKIGYIYTKPKQSAVNLTQINWSKDEDAILWEFEGKKGSIEFGRSDSQHHS